MGFLVPMIRLFVVTPIHPHRPCNRFMSGRYVVYLCGMRGGRRERVPFLTLAAVSISRAFCRASMTLRW